MARLDKFTVCEPGQRLGDPGTDSSGYPDLIRRGGRTVGTTVERASGSWLFGNRKAAEEEQVNRSWQELSDDWDDVEGRDYRARGVSPVDDNLDDINRGWDDPRPPQPCQDFEVPQSPKRVYQDGSIYSYSYRNQDSTGQRDNIYGPPGRCRLRR